jgi:hypothetical protein
MLTYGYIVEAIQAHLDLDEQETLSMNLPTRYHVFANEAMHAICAVKPKYEYFKTNIVEEYLPIISLGDNVFRAATEDEINWEIRGLTEPNFADQTDTIKWYESQNIYILGNKIKMPSDFIAFANKQAWAFVVYTNNSENFVNGTALVDSTPTRVAATNAMFMYTGSNTLTFLQEGEYWIPYKGTWFRFVSNASNDTEIDMPVDILSLIPVYVASQCLQIDHAQKANAKRAEFELALSRISNTDFLDNQLITPSFK